MIAKYVSSSGEEIDLMAFLTRVKDVNFHEYEWEYEGSEQQFGTAISRFKKPVKEYEATVIFRGSDKRRKENLNKFTEIGERDILNKTPGRLICGEYYIESYIIASATSPTEGALWTQKEARFLCPRQFWIKELKKQFYPQEVTVPDKGLDYKYDYSYDYTGMKIGTESWYIDHYSTCEFQMIIYGPCIEPRILIEGHPYEVFDSLEKNEYLLIDSKKNKVTKYLANGKTKNLYDMRGKKNSVFKPIPYGNLDISWNGGFGFDITAFLERSEPEWN